MTPARLMSSAAKCGYGITVALIAFIALSAPVASQEDTSSLAISGTTRSGQELIEGVRFTVTLDGELIGEATTDVTGTWELAVPGPGIYLVEIDVESLPDGVTLRDPTATSREVEIVDRSKGALFALEGSATGEPGGSSTGIDNRDANWQRVFDRFISGIRVGSLVALASVGLSLIFGATGLVNFAHAEMVTYGAIVTILLEEWTGWSLIAVIPLGVLAGCLLGFVLEKGLFGPLRTRRMSIISLMIVSIGLAFVMRHLALIYFGSEPRFFTQFRIQENFDIGPITLPAKDYVIIIVALTVLIIVGLTLQRTKIGTAVRAVSDSRDLAETSGIDVKRTILVVWVAGSGLAALGGIFLGITQRVSWQMGERQLLLMFAAVTLGGLGTGYGAIVGGLAIGLASEMSTLWLDNDLKFLVALGVLVLVLLIRPQGILGRRERLG